VEKNDDIAKYWQRKEQELGGPIVMKSISHTYLSGASDSFGILYASAEVLAYEYSTGGRRSFLDVLLSRRHETEATETLRLPRTKLLAVGLVATGLARRWLLRDVSPAQAAEWLKSMHHPSLLGILSGTSLCVCTADGIFVFDTPANRQWLAVLNG
jgi:hypothetical protein